MASTKPTDPAWTDLDERQVEAFVDALDGTRESAAPTDCVNTELPPAGIKGWGTKTPVAGLIYYPRLSPTK